MSDLNVVFAQAFAEALAPLVQRIEQLEARVWRPSLDLPPDTFDDWVERQVQCGAQPPADDLFPGQEWSPCDLPAGHEEPHNCGLVI